MKKVSYFDGRFSDRLTKNQPITFGHRYRIKRHSDATNLSSDTVHDNLFLVTSDVTNNAKEYYTIILIFRILEFNRVISLLLKLCRKLMQKKNVSELGLRSRESNPQLSDLQ